MARSVVAALTLLLSLLVVSGAAADQALLPADGTPLDAHGQSVALDASTAVVGAPGAEAAYVYTRAGGNWSEIAKLTASGGAAGDGFGGAVAIEDHIIAVGAEGHGPGGAVYLFSRDAATGAWSEFQRLDDSAAGVDVAPGDRFGHALALDGDRLLVGAPGRDTWAGDDAGAVQLILGAEYEPGPWFTGVDWIQGDSVGGEFGAAVALDGDMLVAGAPGPRQQMWPQGVAHAYSITQDHQMTWVGLIGAPNPDPDDRFGTSVAIDGDTVVGGAPRAGDGDQGAAYAFKTSELPRHAVTMLTAASGAAGDGFGTSVAVRGSTIVAGAPGAGAAYVFTAGGASWTELRSKTDSGAYGRSLAMSATETLIGAPNRHGGGAARLFDTAALAFVPKPKAVRGAVLTGVKQPGHVLTSTAATWNTPVYGHVFRWRRCDAAGACSVIAGTPDADDGDSTYTLTAQDVAHTIYVTVTVTNSAGTASATSARTPMIGVPVASARPLLSGVTRSGHVIEATSGAWSGSPSAYAYRWQRCGATCADIPEAAGSAYTLTAADTGKKVRVAVTASNAAGSAFAYSAHTAVVDLPVNTARPTLSGARQPGQALAVTTGAWTPTPDGYAYRWQRCGGGTCVDIPDANASRYVLTAADRGHTVRAAVTATNAAGSATAYAGGFAIP